ncbi:MAG: flagellar export protein FliJ [Chloroflexota bacterium]
MAGFKFRLQSVLDYRSGLVDRARQELATLQARLNEAEAALLALQRAERNAIRQQGAMQMSGTLDLPEITRLLEYAEVLAARIIEQRGVVAQCQQDVDVQQQKMIALAKDARALEKLRERQLEEYQQEDARRERAETSEIASTRHQRAQVASS